jgi:hypothetical protein
MAKGLGGILGNPQLEQILIYNVVGQLVGAALTPYLIALTNELNQATPLVPLSPAEAADAVIRNIMSRDQAAHEASFAGVNGERFDQLVQLAGNAPEPTSLAVALRRKLIDAAAYDRGIRQGRLRDEWANLVRELAVVQPAPTAMLTAYLEGQLDEGDARARYAQLGGDPDYFDILYNTEGQAPTPTQLADLANRGIIGWGGHGPGVVSFEQGFLEGPFRNKWLAPLRQAAAYLPPPRTVTAMHREGSLSDGQALSILEQHGLTAELARAYLASSSRTKLAPHRDLSQSLVLKLYGDRLITREVAASFLEVLDYNAAEAEFVLETADLALAEHALTAAVTRIHTLYTGHKIGLTEATTALANLGVTAENAATLLGIWDHERAANLRHLTTAEIAAAFGLELIDQADAQGRLESQGFTPHDAWLFLSIHHKAALPGEPSASQLTAPAGP